MQENHFEKPLPSNRKEGGEVNKSDQHEYMPTARYEDRGGAERRFNRIIHGELVGRMSRRYVKALADVGIRNGDIFAASRSDGVAIDGSSVITAIKGFLKERIEME